MVTMRMEVRMVPESMRGGVVLRRPTVHLQRLLQHLALPPCLAPALLLLVLLLLLLLLMVLGERRRRPPERSRRGCGHAGRPTARQDERGTHEGRAAHHHLPSLRMLAPLHHAALQA